MYSSKRQIFIISIASVLFFSFTNGKVAKFNKLMVELNKFYPKVINENGEVSLSKIKSNEEELNEVLEQIAVINLHKAHEPAQKMFFVHAHNLHVFQKLNQLNPKDNLEEYEDFYDGESFTVNKGQFTLRSLQHFIMTKFDDPNLIFALYLGGNYSPQPAHPSNKHYEKYFSQLTKDFMNNDSYIRVKPKSEILMLPEYMKWHMKEFNIKDPQEFLKYVNTYRSEENQVPEEYTVKLYPYSWRLK